MKLAVAFVLGIVTGWFGTIVFLAKNWRAFQAATARKVAEKARGEDHRPWCSGAHDRYGKCRPR